MNNLDDYLFSKGDKIALVAPSSTGKSFFTANSILFSPQNRFSQSPTVVLIVGRGSRTGEIAKHAQTAPFELRFLERCPKPDDVQHMASNGHLCIIFEDPMLYADDELKLFRLYWLKYCNLYNITALCTLQGATASVKQSFWREIVLNSSYMIFLDSILCNTDLKKISKIVEPSSKSDFLYHCFNVAKTMTTIKPAHLLVEFKHSDHGFKIRTLFDKDDAEKVCAYGFRRSYEI